MTRKPKSDPTSLSSSTVDSLASPQTNATTINASDRHFREETKGYPRLTSPPLTPAPDPSHAQRLDQDLTATVHTADSITVANKSNSSIYACVTDENSSLILEYKVAENRTFTTPPHSPKAAASRSSAKRATVCSEDLQLTPSTRKPRLSKLAASRSAVIASHCEASSLVMLPSDELQFLFESDALLAADLSD